MKLDVIIPVGPGHEALFNEAVQSVKIACLTGQGPFDEVKVKGVDDSKGELGRSAARNTAIKASDADWLFFLDADDLMHPEALIDMRGPAGDYDAVWGKIYEERDGCILERYQVPFIDEYKTLIEVDPYYTLQMGFFVKREIMPLFDEGMECGEDWKVYLDLWKNHRCLKDYYSFMINRRGHHSVGPRSATGRDWMDAVKELIQEARDEQKLSA